VAITATATLGVLVCLAPRAAHAEMVGVASVIDADTIEIQGQRIRLHGIDAPEGGQTCLDAAGRNWRCGQRAALALQDLIGRRTVTCDERDVDRYGRIVGRCLVGDLAINEWLVAQGPGAGIPTLLP
jgi:endonuclease YncB( thermonuclease family)